MASIWKEEISLPKFPRLHGDIETDVLIVGGGLAGVLCAYKLESLGVKWVLVEAEKLCGGVTQNTTAKITFQHGLIYDKMMRQRGIAKAKLYLEANMAALDEYKELCSDMDCGFEEADSYVYTMDKPVKIRAEHKALKALGIDAELTKLLPLPFSVAAAVKVKKQASFNPLAFVQCLLERHPSLKKNIYENTAVRKIKNNKAFCDKGTIHAKKIIITSHFPFIDSHGGFFLKMYQSRSYVMALKGAPTPEGMFIDENSKGLSFRSYGRILLLGGSAHKTGTHGGNWQELEKFRHSHFPGSQEVCRWAAQDCMSLDKIPYIGQYSAATPDLFVATGFNKWGMTSSMVASGILADLVTDGRNQYSEIFSPSRSIMQPQLAVNIAGVTAGMLKPTMHRCSHLGCGLSKNEKEQSWDCSCHGSRFSYDGNVIDGPAAKDIRRP